MLWDRKRLLGYVEIIQLILGVTDKYKYMHNSSLEMSMNGPYIPDSDFHRL